MDVVILFSCEGNGVLYFLLLQNHNFATTKNASLSVICQQFIIRVKMDEDTATKPCLNCLNPLGKPFLNKDENIH